MCPCRLSEQLNALGEAAAGVPEGQQGSTEDMSGLVDGIMHQLLAKDVLYQPIQEIGARYPQWLADHRYTTWVRLYMPVIVIIVVISDINPIIDVVFYVLHIYIQSWCNLHGTLFSNLYSRIYCDLYNTINSIMLMFLTDCVNPPLSWQKV